MNVIKEMARELDKKFEAREKALKANREIVPKCARAIRLVQKKQFKKAEQQAESISKRIKEVERILKDYPDVKDGVLGAAYQEYAELMIYLDFVQRRKLPSLPVPAQYYLTGLGDAIGELKRHALELLAEGKRKQAEELYQKLEDLYAEYASLAYPGSVAPGLKRKQDVARKVLNDLRETLVKTKI